MGTTADSAGREHGYAVCCFHDLGPQHHRRDGAHAAAGLGSLSDEMREMLFHAESEDAVIAKVMTGKQGRMLSTAYVDSWQQPGAPAPLTWPMQSILNGYSYKRAERGRNLDYWTYAVGQVVGDMKSTTTVKREFERMLNEYGDALESLMPVIDLD